MSLSEKTVFELYEWFSSLEKRISDIGFNMVYSGMEIIITV